MEDKKKVKLRKKITPGVIYLSRIPPLINVKKIRDIFSEFDEIGRIFLQPDGMTVQLKFTLTKIMFDFCRHNLIKNLSLFVKCATEGAQLPMLNNILKNSFK